jgi:hypothetical protein
MLADDLKRSSFGTLIVAAQELCERLLLQGVR